MKVNMLKLLVLGDIHANWPALKAVVDYIKPTRPDGIIQTGDLTVYGTFPNETIRWFRKKKKTFSILGNTDLKLLRILHGKKLKRPRKEEKRVMYFWTAGQLSKKNRRYLESLPPDRDITLNKVRIGIFHGTVADAEEALGPDAPASRFRQLAHMAPYQVQIMGHSHRPYYKKAAGVHFINPGSVGRMHDGDPRASFAIVGIAPAGVTVTHFRIPYPVRKTVAGIDACGLPPIYKKMFEIGKKLN